MIVSIGIDTLLVGLISFLVIYIVWNSMRRKHNLPPGPTPLPLIGNLLQIQRGQLAKSLLKFSKQYGSVYTLYFGKNPVICLSGYETVKEALVDKGEEFGGRGRVPTLEKVTQGYGISFSNGERWRQLRNFTFRNLRQLGFGKKSFEEKIQEETKNVVEELKNMKGEPLDVTKLLMDAASNILFSIVFGSRCEYKDEKFVRLLGIVEETFHLMSSPWGQLHTIFPQIMDYIPGPHQKISSISEELMSFITQRVKISQETLEPALPRHFIDNFLLKMEREKNNPNSEFTERNLVVTVHNLFIAGTDSVSVLLRHTFLVILYYPEIQEKLHLEIDEVIGRDRIPNLSDRVNMPYTEAIMHEVLRFCDLVPFNTPHQVTKDVEFRGYVIPKGTDVYTLFFTVHRDPTKFSTPFKFNPNHFLDENGKFQKNEGLMAFSAGKRSCPGESLAWMEFFLFLTTILQNFKLISQTRFTESDITPKLAGFLNEPIHYELSFIPR
uniref:Cytochrome P450 n=1 Tax=Leptobrachium leishanense TaxID=445787 RepID=A0A8C5WMD5_9ANUR